MHNARYFHDAVRGLRAHARRVALVRSTLPKSARTLLRATGTLAVACAVGGAGHALEQQGRPSAHPIAPLAADAGTSLEEGGSGALLQKDANPHVRIADAAPHVAPESVGGATCGSGSPSTVAPPNGAGAVSIIDLNAATVAELTTLPGIGQKRAERILALRERLGRFRSVDDLHRAPGFGRSLVKRLRPLVRIGPADVSRGGAPDASPRGTAGPSAGETGVRG